MTRKIRVFGLVTLLGLLAIVLFFGASAWAQKKRPSPPPPPADPAIAYTALYKNHMDLMVMNADGSNQRAVASEMKVYNGWPDWSPDGKQLVFTRYNTRYIITGGDGGLYIINVDGKNLRKVMNTNGIDGAYDVSWSPVPLGDGKYKIAFSDRAKLPDGTLSHYYDIFLVNLDGTGLVNLTNTPNLQEFKVDWSFRGDKIAVANYDPVLHAADLVVYRIDYDYTTKKFSAISLGSVIRVKGSPLEFTPDAYYPDWAKTQDKLVVEAQQVRGAAYDLWTIDLEYPFNPNNPNHIRLTYTPDVSEGFPSWSPDDKKIVFTGWDWVIWVMNWDGTGAKKIATPPAGVVFWELSWRRNL